MPNPAILSQSTEPVQTGPGESALRGLEIVREKLAGLEKGPDPDRGVEILAVEQGKLAFLVGGQKGELSVGGLLLFWGAAPYWLEPAKLGCQVLRISIPFSTFFSGMAPPSLSKFLLSGWALAVENSREEFADSHTISAWRDGLRSKNSDLRKSVELAFGGALYRLASLRCHTVPQETARAPFDQVQQAGNIAQFVTANFTRPINASDIARAVQLHPATASKLFKRICGTSFTRFLTQLRMSLARQLLTTSAMDIREIVGACGYRSVSRFYVAYKGIHGYPPKLHRSHLGRGD